MNDIHITEFVTVGCPSVRLSRRSASAACPSLRAGSSYRSTAAGARAAAVGSVMWRAEVRRLNTDMKHEKFVRFDVACCAVFNPKRLKCRVCLSY